MFETLEALAYRFVALPENMQLMLVGGEFLLGALLALVSPGVRRLSRIPYFGCWALLFLLFYAAQFVWSLSGLAAPLQLIWGVTAAYMLSYLLAGYFFLSLALARSRDAFDKNAGAVLAFIPLLNLVLFFWPSREGSEETEEMRVPALFRGAAGLVSGSIMMTLVVVLTGFMLVGIYTLRHQEQVTQAEIVYPEERLQAALAEPVPDVPPSELGAQLEEIVASARLPQQIDAITRLNNLEAKGNTLRYAYETLSKERVLPDDIRIDKHDVTCGAPRSYALVKAGAIFEYVYHRTDGSVMGRVKIAKTECDNWRASGHPSTEFLLQSQGLEKTLAFIASNQIAPVEVEKGVLLTDVQADGVFLRHIYTVRTQMGAPSDVVDNLTANLCRDREFRRVFREGATFQYVYNKPDGTLIQLANINQYMCVTRVLFSSGDVMRAALKEQPLEEALQTIADGVRVPIRMDELTDLEAVRAEGRVLVNVFSLDTDMEKINESGWARVIDTVCNSPSHVVMLEAGATLEYEYIRSRDNHALGMRQINLKDCPAKG